jgi:hypothetical protein
MIGISDSEGDRGENRPANVYIKCGTEMGLGGKQLREKRCKTQER